MAYKWGRNLWPRAQDSATSTSTGVDGGVELSSLRVSTSDVAVTYDPAKRTGRQ
jgi:hypothetical protein